jgi:aminoglycoside phosphotransferase (APT) family kinase protein
VLVRADLEASPPYAIFEALAGQPGYVVADHDLSAPVFPLMAEAMGRLLRRLQAIPVEVLELPLTWADPRSLARTAAAWLGTTEPLLSVAEVAQVQRLIDTLPGLFAGRPIVVAHGDYGPANVLFEGAQVTALLDLESARLADPLFDLAWWKWLLHAHTPRAFELSWPQFLAAAEVDPGEEDFEQRIFALLTLRLLETTASYAGTGTHEAWVERLSRALVEYAP